MHDVPVHWFCSGCASILHFSTLPCILRILIDTKYLYDYMIMMFGLVFIKVISLSVAYAVHSIDHKRIHTPKETFFRVS